MEQRRSFLKKVGALTGVVAGYGIFNELSAATLEDASRKIAHLSPMEVAQNEDYWQVIQQGYTVNSNLINLNNGGVSPSPRVVQEAVKLLYRSTASCTTLHQGWCRKPLNDTIV